MWLAAAPSLWAAGLDPQFKQMVETDWAAQEKRLNRTDDSWDAVKSASDRAWKLIEDLRTTINVTNELLRFNDLRTRVARMEILDAPQRRVLYREIRWLTRDLALRNPLLAGRPIAFLLRKRYVCQMLHEYLGYYYGDLSGGGVYVLEKPGYSLNARELTKGRLAEGNFTTLALSYDAKTLYFAFADKSAPKPDYYAPQKGGRFFHIFSIDANGADLRQLTNEQFDDFDPCPLPDGGIAFMSTRRGAGFGRCHNPWEPLPAYTLHRMDADGRNIRTLSWHETNEWHPSVLHDGRIVYIRWDYVDRGAANFHGMWISNPDGANPSILFGNYTTRINACYQPRAIPGSRRILFLAGAHHADVGGSLVILDPDRARLARANGEDDLAGVEALTPEVCFPESAGWPDSYFHSPWPLSDKYFLTAFSFEPLPRMGGPTADHTGIYYLDRFGNMELLYRREDIACMYPIPLQDRPVPPIVKSALDANMNGDGEFMLTDVRQSFFPMPRSRPVRALRIFQVLPKTTHVANEPRIGYANAESARMLLGSVPVESDGSAYFRAPARKPIYFQAVDENGRAVQTMRSVTYLQPGERRGCLGCHEGPGTTISPKQTQAMRRNASIIAPGPDGSRPLSFPRLVQPVLDRHCVRCHDGSRGEGRSNLSLTGDARAKSPFSRAYDNLRPFVRWYEWGDNSIGGTVTRPGFGGADSSALSKALDDPTHAALKLPKDDLRRIYLWLDSNAPFYGTYGKSEQAAQKRGEPVPEPAAQ